MPTRTALAVALACAFAPACEDSAGTPIGDDTTPELPTDPNPDGGGDDITLPPEGATITIPWTLGDITCETWFIAELEAHALDGDTVVASVTAACPATASNGEIALPGLPAGTFAIEVEGIDTLGQARFIGVAEAPVEVDAPAVASDTVRLGPKPAALNLSWTAPLGGCAAAGFATVDIQLLDSGFVPLRDFEVVSTACDTALPAALAGTGAHGGLRLELDPADQLIVAVYGVDEAGVRVAEGRRAGVDLGLGDELDVEVTLKMCPQVPCASP